jgi:hypothetical protein
MIVHEGKNVRNAQEARAVAGPEYNMSGTADCRNSTRDIVNAIGHAWTVVCGEIFKGLEKASSLH